MKLNDIRVLRNILGDKYKDGEEDEVSLARYTPKKMNTIILPKMSENFKLKGDAWSWNKKVGKKDPDLSWTINVPPEQVISYDNTKIKPSPIPVDSVSTIQKMNKNVLERTALLKAQRDLEKVEFESLPESRAYDRNKLLLDQEMKRQYVEQSGIQLLQAQQNTALAQRKSRGDVGLRRYEQSGFGQFLKGPWTKTAGKVVENIGQNLGGSIVGPFTTPDTSKRLNDTQLAKSAYMDLLRRRHSKKGETINTPADVEALGTLTERKRFRELTHAVERAQQIAASGGFMGGGSGQMIIGQARRQPNLQQFTQVGGGSQYGSFSPEAFGRLGVTQSLRAIRPENKWDNLLSRGTGAPNDRVAQILGKTPDPLGAGAKVKKVLSPIGLGSEDPRDKLKRFL